MYFSKLVRQAQLEQLNQQELQEQSSISFLQLGPFCSPTHKPIIIEAFSFLRRYYQNISLVIVDDSCDVAELNRKVKTLRMDNCVHIEHSYDDFDFYMNKQVDFLMVPTTRILPQHLYDVIAKYHFQALFLSEYKGCHRTERLDNRKGLNRYLISLIDIIENAIVFKTRSSSKESCSIETINDGGFGALLPARSDYTEAHNNHRIN